MSSMRSIYSYENKLIPQVGGPGFRNFEDLNYLLITFIKLINIYKTVSVLIILKQ